MRKGDHSCILSLGRVVSLVVKGARAYAVVRQVQTRAPKLQILVLS
jgi:hypothetical protein